MTHSAAQFWSQPGPGEVLIDEKNALMTRDSFAKLHEYSTSIPTGVYAGKMWKKNVLQWEGQFLRPTGKWYLGFFAHDHVGVCTIHFREIILV